MGVLAWALAAAAWLYFSAAWLRGALTAHRVLADLRHPLLGPFVALVPVVAILLGGQSAHYVPAVGAGLVVAALVVIGIMSAWSLSAILAGTVDAHVFHSGYFLFILAGGLIGAIGLAEIGALRAATAAFAIGVFFWAVLAAVVVARLAAGPAIADAYVPTLAIFSVPPSVAGLGWFGIHGSQIDWVQDTLLALTVFLVLSQGFLVHRYAKLPFSLGFWSFTFTAAAPVSYGMHWLAATTPPGWRIWSWVMLLAVTLWIVWIAVRSVPLLFGRGARR